MYVCGYINIYMCVVYAFMYVHTNDFIKSAYLEIVTLASC